VTDQPKPGSDLPNQGTTLLTDRQADIVLRDLCAAGVTGAALIDRYVVELRKERDEARESARSWEYTAGVFQDAITADTVAARMMFKAERKSALCRLATRRLARMLRRYLDPTVDRVLNSYRRNAMRAIASEVGRT
jgi:hypothetical protein